MKTRQSRRQTAKVSHSRWLAYATASAATALAGSHSLEAAIHYSGRVDVLFPPDEFVQKTYQLDQPADFFQFYHTSSGLPLLGSKVLRPLVLGDLPDLVVKLFTFQN